VPERTKRRPARHNPAPFIAEATPLWIQLSEGWSRSPVRCCAMRCVPVNLARELLITGARLGAQRAYEIGFVNRLADQGNAVGVALELAAEVCASSPASVRATLQALDEQWVADEAVGWDATARAVQRIQAGPDLE
jgi:enoyl-CoA hydratase